MFRYKDFYSRVFTIKLYIVDKMLNAKFQLKTGDYYTVFCRAYCTLCLNLHIAAFYKIRPKCIKYLKAALHTHTHILLQTMFLNL